MEELEHKSKSYLLNYYRKQLKHEVGEERKGVQQYPTPYTLSKTSSSDACGKP